MQTHGVFLECAQVFYMKRLTAILAIAGIQVTQAENYDLSLAIVDRI